MEADLISFIIIQYYILVFNFKKAMLSPEHATKLPCKIYVVQIKVRMYS